MIEDPLAIFDRAVETALEAMRAGDAAGMRLALATGGLAEVSPGPAFLFLADAIEAERNGDTDAFRRAMDDDRAYETTIPELTYHATRFFLRVGRVDRAYCGFARLAMLGHDYWHEFVDAALEAPATFGSVLRHVFEANGELDLGVPMRLKASLCARLPVAAAFASYRDAMRLPRDAAIRRKPLGSLLDAARERSVAFVELYPGGKPLTMNAPRIVGPGTCAGVFGVSRSAFIAAFDGASVHARSSVISLGDDVYLDVQDGESLADFGITFDPVVFARDGGAVYTIDTDDVLDIDEAVRVGGPTSSAFGHWMWEYVPQWAASHAAAPHGTPIVIDPAMPATHRESLAYFTNDAVPIVELTSTQTLRARRLWVASNRLCVPMRPPNEASIDMRRAIAPQRETAAVYQSLASDADRLLHGDEPSRVYLARRPWQHRKLTNAGAIEEAATRAGYAIVYPEELSFREQLRLIRGATYLAGPEGSAFFLALFARPETRVTILNHPYVTSAMPLTTLLEAIPLDVSVVCGRFVDEDPVYTRFSSYEVDVDTFVDVASAATHA